MKGPENTPGGQAPGKAAESVDKKPYRSPRILFREPLEALAAVCNPGPPANGKSPGSIPICLTSQT